MEIDFDGIAQVITAVGILIVGIMTALNNMRINKISDKTTAIEAHVNSEKTADNARIQHLTEINLMKQQMLDEKDRVAGLLAQSLALKNAGGRFTDSPSKDAATTLEKVLEPKLEEIADNTKAIDINTQKIVKNK